MRKTRKQHLTQRWRGYAIGKAFAVALIVAAAVLVTLLSPTTTQRGAQSATAGAIHITTGAVTVGAVSHSQALISQATQQTSGTVSGLAAIVPRDSMAVMLLIILLAVALFAFAVRLTYSDSSLRTMRVIPTMKRTERRRYAFKVTFVSWVKIAEKHPIRGLRAGLTPVMTAFAPGSLAVSGSAKI